MRASEADGRSILALLGLKRVMKQDDKIKAERGARLRQARKAAGFSTLN
jgi:hypothetical protein